MGENHDPASATMRARAADRTRRHERRVYLAHDGALGRDVAVKILSEHYAEDLEIRRRFQREAQAAAHLSGHEHIVTIFDVGEWHGRPFIVMEHLGGGTLAERSGGRGNPLRRSAGSVTRPAQSTTRMPRASCTAT